MENINFFIKNEKNLANSFIDAHDQNKKIYLYGAGEAAYWYITFLKKHNLCVDKIIVTSNSPQMQSKYGISVVALDDISFANDDYEIIIATPMYKKEVYDNLKEKANLKAIFSFEAELYCNFVSNTSDLRDYYIDNIDRLYKLYHCLEDNLSKKTFIAFLKGRISANQDYYQDVRVPDAYYPNDIISMNDEEILLELGSNNGETLLDFLKKVNRKYKKCICFEPDLQCISQLQAIKEQENGKIEIIEKGAYDKHDFLYFSSDSSDEKHATAHILAEESDTEIEVDSVDNCVDEVVTFLKMDIEGAEMKALLGCENVIKRCKPKLAISVYHNNEDILEISEYIKLLVPEYKLFLRHHNYSATDTILYAVL